MRYRLTPRQRKSHPRLAGKDVYTIIWTTTPWTLPASEAVAFNPELEYVAIDNWMGGWLRLRCREGTAVVGRIRGG